MRLILYLSHSRDLNNEPGGGESPQSASGQRAVFLSYASEDAAAAGLVAASLRAAGVEATDGSEIVFDRVQESSELALIERGR